MSTATRIIKNSGFLYGKMAITIFISLYTTRLVLDSLGTSDFGIYAVVGGAIAMMTFLNASMAGATQRFMSFYEGKKDEGKQKQIFNISFILHIMIAIVLGIALLILGLFLFNGILNIPADRIDAAKIVYGALILSTLFTVTSCPYEAVLNAHENMLYYAILGVLESLLKLLAAILVTNYWGDKLELYGILMACVPFITLTILRWYCHKKYSECVIAPIRFWNKDMFKEITSFGGWTFFGTSASMIVNYGQGIVTNAYFTPEVNASQGIAAQISGQLNALTLNMIKALNPVIAKSAGANDNQTMVAVTIAGSKMSCLIMISVFIPVWIEIPYILSIWLTETPVFAELFCRLILINTFLGYLFIPVTTSLSSYGQIKQFQIVIAILNYASLASIWYLFASGFEPFYSYIILGIHSLIAGSIKLYYANKFYQFPVFIFLNTVVFKCLLVGAITSIIACIPHFYLPSDIYRVLIVGILSTMAFLISVWFLGFDRKERLLSKSVLTSLLAKLTSIRRKDNK